MKPVFVKTWAHHESYYDYWKLVELSGFETVAPCSIDLESPVIYVFTGTRPEYLRRLERLGPLKHQKRKCVLVYYWIERPDSGPGEDGRDLKTLFRSHLDRYTQDFDVIWTPYGLLSKMDDRAVYVLMGSHPGLRESEIQPSKDIDLAILAHPNDRRTPILSRLSGYRIASRIRPGIERGKVLSRSKCQFVIHQTSSPLPEPQRLAFSAAYELPFLTETIDGQDPLLEGKDFLHAPISEIVERLAGWLALLDLESIGKNLWRKLVVENPFPLCIENAVRATLKRLSLG